MDYQNYSVPAQNKDSSKDSSILGVVFLIPIIFIILIFLVVPIVSTFFRSFTDTDFITKSRVIMFKNYEHLFKDAPAGKSILNTALTLLANIPLTVGAGFFFAWLASKIHKPLRIILCVLFVLVSITAVTPTGLNVLLHSAGQPYLIFTLSSFFHGIIAILINYLLGIGPLFFIFTAYFIRKDDVKKYFHLAVSLQIIICILSFNPFRLLVISPEFMRMNLPGYIYDQMIMMMNFGYGSALLVVLGVLLLLFFLLFNGIVWLIGLMTKSESPKEVSRLRSDKEEKKSPVLSLIIFLLLFATAMSLLYPFLRTFFDSFKSQNELSASAGFFASRPTMDNYSAVLGRDNGGMPIGTILWNSVLAIITATAVLFPVSILGSIGFAILGKRFKRSLVLFVIITFVLSPVALLFFTRNDFGNELLIAAAVKVSLRGFILGLCIFFSTKILEKGLQKYQKPVDMLSSAADVIKYLLGILAVVFLCSLSAYFNPVYLPNNPRSLTLYQLCQRYVHMPASGGTSASAQVISMIIPIGIAVIFIPILYLSLEQKSAPTK